MAGGGGEQVAGRQTDGPAPWKESCYACVRVFSGAGRDDLLGCGPVGRSLCLGCRRPSSAGGTWPNPRA